jgi:hypothetical protein
MRSTAPRAGLFRVPKLQPALYWTEIFFMQEQARNQVPCREKPSPDAGFTRGADAPTHLTEAEYTSAVNTLKAARSASGCRRVDLILRTLHGVFSRRCRSRARVPRA